MRLDNEQKCSFNSQGLMPACMLYSRVRSSGLFRVSKCFVILCGLSQVREILGLCLPHLACHEVSQFTIHLPLVMYPRTNGFFMSSIA